MAQATERLPSKHEALGSNHNDTYTHTHTHTHTHSEKTLSCLWKCTCGTPCHYTRSILWSHSIDTIISHRHRCLRSLSQPPGVYVLLDPAGIGVREPLRWLLPSHCLKCIETLSNNCLAEPRHHWNYEKLKQNNCLYKLLNFRMTFFGRGGALGFWTQGFNAYKADTLMLELHLQSILFWLFWRWGFPREPQTVILLGWFHIPFLNKWNKPISKSWD
jgi:hypothetical protein